MLITAGAQQAQISSLLILCVNTYHPYISQLFLHCRLATSHDALLHGSVPGEGVEAAHGRRSSREEMDDQMLPLIPCRPPQRVGDGE